MVFGAFLLFSSAALLFPLAVFAMVKTIIEMLKDEDVFIGIIIILLITMAVGIMVMMLSTC